MPNDAPDWVSHLQPQTLLTPAGGVAVAQTGTLQVVGTYTLQAGAHGVAIAWTANGPATFIQVIGQTTSVDWAATQALPLFNSSPNKTAIQVIRELDNQVQVVMQFPSHVGSATVWVAAVLAPIVVTIDRSQAANASLVGTVTGSIVETLLGRNANPDLGVTLAGSNPPPWLKPSFFIYAEGSLTALNGTNLLAAPGGGQAYWIHGWELETDSTGGFLALRDGGIAAPNGRFAHIGGTGQVTGDGGGTRLTSGQPIVIDTGGGAITGRLHLHYSTAL